jgi:hypothetical protein
MIEDAGARVNLIFHQSPHSSINIDIVDPRWQGLWRTAQKIRW